MKKYYLATVLCLMLVGCLSTPQKTLIQSDPDWVSGQLENGLVYHVYPDHEKSVSVRLIVHAGSFQEDTQQEGYAHFVEHMAFNGSKNFSQNGVINFFEEVGVSFGADLNAYTADQETVYQLDLPDKTQLEPALTWLRDIGDGLDMAASEVEKEKGVILGEFRYARLDDKPFLEKFYDHFIEGSPYESQDALGTKESINNANSQGLRSFYQTWYQPQIVEVVVSGDIDIRVVIPLIENQFSDWERGQTAKPEKQKITAFNEDDYIEYAGDEAPSISLMINRASSVIENYPEQHQLWLDEISQHLIQQRLISVFNEAALPTQWVSSENYFMEYQRYSITSVGFPTGSREVTQKELLSALASLRDYGVSKHEVINEKRYYQNLLDNVEVDWKKRDNTQLADYKAAALVIEQKVQSQRDYQISMEIFLANLDLDVVNANIKMMLSSDYFILIGMDDDENRAAITNSLKSLKSTYSKAGTPPLFIKTRNAFSISNPQGEIILNEQMYTDPNIQRWTLSNGIDMWYLRDSQANDDVGIYYTSLGGKDALSPNLYPAIEVTIPAISRSGVGDFNGTEFDAYLTSQDIQVHPFIDFTRHGIQLKVKKDVLKETFATLNAVVTSVKVSPEQLEAVKQEFIQDRKSYLESSIGQFSQAMNQNTYKLESSHFLIDGSSVESVSVEDVRNVHQQLFGQLRNNQLIIVGNIDPRELKPLVRKYVASIPLKKGVVPEFKVAYKQPSKERVELAINNVNTTEYILRTIAEKVSRQTAKDVFMEDLLQRILNTRLNSYIREELSLDYSPDSYSVSQDGESSYDWFITASVAPENIDKIEVAIDKVITGLLQGISENELRIAAKQLEADFTPLDVNPVDQAWFVSRYLMYNYGVEALFDIEAMANSISSEDMNELAKRIFGNKSRKIKNIMSPQALVY